MPPAELVEVLEEAQRRGLIGPGALDVQIRHALALGEAALGGGPVGAALDLGSGGGLPGLVLAWAWTESSWTLLDARRRSAAFLCQAVEALALGGRVSVLEARAEDAGRHPQHRGHYALVTGRGFGWPAVTAECAAPLLELGGRLVVSEPPEAGGQRWPASGLELLGLQLQGVVMRGGASFAVLQQVAPCPSTYPRRSGLPGKRPLFPNPAVDVSRETNPVLERWTAEDQDGRQ